MNFEKLIEKITITAQNSQNKNIKYTIEYFKQVIENQISLWFSSDKNYYSEQEEGRLSYNFFKDKNSKDKNLTITFQYTTEKNNIIEVQNIIIVYLENIIIKNDK